MRNGVSSSGDNSQGCPHSKNTVEDERKLRRKVQSKTPLHFIWLNICFLVLCSQQIYILSSSLKFLHVDAFRGKPPVVDRL